MRQSTTVQGIRSFQEHVEEEGWGLSSDGSRAVYHKTGTHGGMQFAQNTMITYPCNGYGQSLLLLRPEIP